MASGPGRALRLVAIVALLVTAIFVIWLDQQSSENNGALREPGPSQVRTAAAGSGFDFYVLALSWSPSYCEAEGQQANRQQCDSGRPYAFVVHGLWPQFELGYPQNCPTGQAEVPNQTLRGLYDLMPSAGLIRHQWKKHGTCSGLSQADYFATLRAARDKVVIPEEFRRLDAFRSIAPTEAETAFLKSNATLPSDGIAVTCDKNYLREVRICLTKELGFRACPEVDRRSCRLDRAVMPPVRGTPAQPSTTQ